MLRMLNSALVWGVLCLLLVEAILRWEPVHSRLPPADAYYQPAVDMRLRALNEVLREYGHVDLLFIGSSVVRTNFKPLEFDKLYTARTGRSWISFNGGLSEIKPDAVRLYLENFWLQHLEPKVVFQGIRYVEIRDELSAGGYERFDEGRFEPLWIADTPWAVVRAWILEHVRLLYYRGVLRKALVSFPEPVSAGYPIDARGYNATKKTLEQARTEGLIDDVWSYSNEWRGVEYPVSLTALRKSAHACREKGVEYVLVNMPEHPERFMAEADGRERYQAYLNMMQNFADSEGVDFIDVTEGDVISFSEPDWFSDGHHFSPDGASEFTLRLAEAYSSRQ